MKKGTVTQIGIPSNWSSDSPDIMIEAVYIGGGAFSKVYLSGDSVYAFTSMKNHNNDYSKEIISNCSASEFLPEIERLGYTLSGDYLVYKMPFYQKLTAKNANAWQLAKLLQSNQWKIRQDLESVKDILPESLYDTLYEILHDSYNYGEYIFEFNKANLAVDEKGNLILLDVIFSSDALQEIRKNTEKNRNQRYNRNRLHW